MLGTHKLLIDTHSTVYDLLKPYADDEFWEFSSVDLSSNSVCVVGRQQFTTNLSKVVDLVNCGHTIVFDNAAEGSLTLHEQMSFYQLRDLNSCKKLLLLSGGDLDQSYSYILHDHFFNVILGYDYNTHQMSRIDEIYSTKNKPYKFLFLNGRARPHRTYLCQQFDSLGVLAQSLYTMLEGPQLQQLPPHYEVEQYQCNQVANNATSTKLIKHEIFNNTWGEIYARADPYIDTYFSLVSETVMDYPYSFRTEKIAKPILLGHPWIVAANRGFYRDLKKIGFQTFGHVIDESFDLIDNTQDRLDRIIEIVVDLCQQDLASFLDSCYSVCKYNQQHLQEYRQQLRTKFPARFLEYINERS
jgi:hypothetical protein